MIITDILNAIEKSKEGFVCRELFEVLTSGRLIFISEPRWVAIEEGLERIKARISIRMAVPSEILPELHGAAELMEALTRSNATMIGTVMIRESGRHFLAFFDETFHFIGAFLAFLKNFDEEKKLEQLRDRKKGGKSYGGDWFFHHEKIERS